MILRTYGNQPYNVALVHGGPGAIGEMEPVARELAADFSVLEPIQTEITLDGQVEELKVILEGHTDRPVALVGFSWGACLSYIVTAKYPHLIKKLVLVGSGPFGTIASLVSQTFLHRQTLERPALPAVALTNDAGLATFLAIDDQESQLFSRQLRALASAQDTLLVFAGTELSAADREAIQTAQQMGCRTILVASEQTELADVLPDISLALPSDSLPRLVESTLFIGNLLCTLVEGELFGI